MAAEHRAADDRLDDVLDPPVDRRHAVRAVTQRDRVDALEAADLQDVAPAEAEARVELLDAPIRDLLGGVALAAPRRAPERPAATVDREAVPGQQRVQGLEVGIVDELDERRLEMALVVAAGGGRTSPPAESKATAHAR